MTKTRIDGAAQLFELLDALPEKLANATERKVFKNTMAPKYVAMAKGMAPIDEGWLQQSLTSAVTKSKKFGLRLRVGIGSVGANIKRGKGASDKPWYGRLIETGYMLTTKEPGHKRIRQVPAQPFLTPTLELAAKEAPELFKSALLEEVKTASARYAKKWVKK